MFFLKALDSGLTPHSRSLNVAGGSGNAGNFTWPCRQHPPNFLSLLLEDVSFSESKCKARQWLHSIFIGPSECLRRGSLYVWSSSNRCLLPFNLRWKSIFYIFNLSIEIISIALNFKINSFTFKLPPCSFCSLSLSFISVISEKILYHCVILL